MQKLRSALPSLILFLFTVCTAFAASPIYPDLCDSRALGLFFASPSGGSGKPLFRAIVNADLSSTTVAKTDSSNSWSTAQLPNATGTIDLGSAALAFRDLFLGGSSSNYHKITGTTPTGARVFTLPDANSNSVIPSSAGANQFATGISAAGVISYAQAAFSGLTGTATASQLPSGVSYFGGDGSDGAVTKGTTSDTIIQINSTTFTQTASTTWTPDSGCVVNSSSTQTWNGTTTVAAQGWWGGRSGQGGLISDSEGAALYATPGLFNGSGPGAGCKGVDNTTNAGGGGGGGAAGNGGDGGTPAGIATAIGGGSYNLSVSLVGSGGGSGGFGGSGAGGSGGRGGGDLRACAKGQITIGNSAIIQANGGDANAGTANKCCGGGGGGAGYLGFYSQTGIDKGSNTNSIRVNGGSGGAAGNSVGGEGGGGGAGFAVLMSPSNTGSSTPSATGGDGNGKTGVNGSDGSSGTVTSITGTPNLPLIAHIEKSIGTLTLLCKFREYELNLAPGNTIELDHIEVADFIAAIHNVDNQFGALRYALLQGGSESQIAKLTNVNCTGMYEICPVFHCETTAYVGNFVEMSNAA